MIDWDMATNTARTLTPSGPKVSRRQAVAAVEQLRVSALRAHALVEETARMHPENDGPGALVVDRSAWIDANVAGFREMLDPAMGRIVTRGGERPMSPWAIKVGGKASAVEMGGVLSVLARRVLGQYVTGFGLPAEAARLLLVAPNVVSVERQLGLHPTDFRLWVCLHEETHRVQFTAVPWLRDFMHASQQQLIHDLSGSLGGVGELVKVMAKRLPEATREGGGGLTALLLDEPTRARLGELNAHMALLEGHADVVMDDVGPRHIPSVGTIRDRFDTRRQTGNPLDLLLKRLVGLEAKLTQYRDGAAFVRAVQQRVGVDGFNAVWTSPETLPTAAELRAPEAWVARVHG